jgi:transcriptional regulator with XRE-family HTH domain
MNVELIFATLDERGIRQQWLADKLGVDKSLLSKYRTGKRPMPVAHVARSAELLNLPVDYLMSTHANFPFTSANSEAA